MLWNTEHNGDLTFTPKPAQAAFLESVAREILFSGHWGNGKSIALCLKLWLLAELFPGAPLALLRKEYSDLKLSTLRHLRRVLGERMWARGMVGGESPKRFEFPNGSFIDFVGLKDNANKLLSTEYVGIGCDECNELTEADWEMADGRLRSPMGRVHQIFGACNPDNPEHWLYKRFNLAQGSNLQSENGQPIRQAVMAGAGENDENLPAGYLAMKSRLTGARGQRFRDGLWVAFEGLVFDMFVPDIHVLQAPPPSWQAWGGYPPPDWPRYRGIDFGFYPSAFTTLWAAFDHQDRAYVYRQYGWTRRTPSQHAKMLKAHDELELRVLRERARTDHGWSEQQIARELAYLPMFGSYADHDEADAAELARNGVNSTPAKKGPGSVRARTFLVMEFLTDVPGFGPRLLIVKNPRNDLDPTLVSEGRPATLEAELAALLWSRDARGTINREEPEDSNNHFTDALGYLLYTRESSRTHLA